MKLIVNNTHEYPDYPVGIRFVPVPKPMFTGSEIVTAYIVGNVCGALFTALAAYVWSFFL